MFGALGHNSAKGPDRAAGKGDGTNEHTVLATLTPKMRQLNRPIKLGSDMQPVFVVLSESFNPTSNVFETQIADRIDREGSVGRARFGRWAQQDKTEFVIRCPQSANSLDGGSCW